METALGERGTQVRTLTAAVEREQQGREDDARHWLARLEEQRGALTDASAREGLLVAEKRALREEVARLRRAVAAVARTAAAGATARPAGGGGRGIAGRGCTA
jgi:hypothetical protein